MFTDKGLIKMYAPNGAEVYLPFDPANTNALVLYEQEGLSPLPPGEYERERRSQIGAFVVRSHVNPDGSETPVVDLYFRHRNGYTDRLRSMRVYLNTDRDIERFQAAFGVRLDGLNIYDGDTPIERGKRPQQERFVYEPSRPVWVVWRLNPASKNDEQAPKRLFVRWETAGAERQHQHFDGKYPPNHRVIMDTIFQVAKGCGYDPDAVSKAFLEAAKARPGVHITPAQAVAWVFRKYTPAE